MTWAASPLWLEFNAKTWHNAHAPTTADCDCIHQEHPSLTDRSGHNKSPTTNNQTLDLTLTLYHSSMEQ